MHEDEYIADIILNTPKTPKEQENNMISVLKKCRTLEEAAKALGISRTTLWRKMKKYKVSRTFKFT